METKIIKLDLSELIEPGITDSISGRTFGEGYAEKKQVLAKIQEGYSFVVIIDDKKIKAINDSFWKGFFSELFKKYKYQEKVKTFFTFESNIFFKEHIEKNLIILDSIYNAG
jgi:hypothetical protein